MSRRINANIIRLYRKVPGFAALVANSELHLPIGIIKPTSKPTTSPTRTVAGKLGQSMAPVVISPLQLLRLHQK